MFDIMLIERSSELPREFSENFRKCSESFVCPSDNTLKNFYRRSEFIGKSSSCFLLKLTADQVTFYRCIAGSIFFSCFEFNLKLICTCEFFFEAARAIFSLLKNSLVQITLYRMITYSNNIQLFNIQYSNK